MGDINDTHTSCRANKGSMSFMSSGKSYICLMYMG